MTHETREADRRRHLHDCLRRHFRYTRALSAVTGLPPEVALGAPDVGDVLERPVPWSVQTSREVTALVRRELAAADWSRIPWAGDLLAYEGALLEAEADDAPDDGVVVELRHDVPSVLLGVLARPDDPPQAGRTATVLHIRRSADGSVEVSRLEPAAV